METNLSVNDNGSTVCVNITTDTSWSIACAEMDDMGDHWWISRVLVRDIFLRRQGLGTQLVKTLQEHSRGQKIIVCPGGYDLDYEQQRSFYESCGFIEVKNGQMEWETNKERNDGRNYGVFRQG